MNDNYLLGEFSMSNIHLHYKYFAKFESIEAASKMICGGPDQDRDFGVPHSKLLCCNVQRDIQPGEEIDTLPSCQIVRNDPTNF